MNEKPRDDTATTILRRTAPAWYWLRANFSLTSLLTLASVVCIAGGYIIHLQTRVTLIDHEVTDLKQVVPTSATVASLTTRVDSAEARLQRLEANWDAASAAAASAPYPAAARAPRRASR